MPFYFDDKGMSALSLSRKIDWLHKYLQDLGSVAVAFSGGVDSTFLAVAAQRALGGNTVAITAVSETLSGQEKHDIRLLVKTLNLKHAWLEATDLENEDFLVNDKERCYYCKKERFSALINWAAKKGYLYVAEGSNVDDLTDYRPGMRALAELKVVKSPLLEVGLDKEDIRLISREWGLPTWDKPSAACLVSRLSYGLRITPERLEQVDKAEAFLRGYIQGQLRVRHHGDLARIEVEQQHIAKLLVPDTANAIEEAFKKLGFTYVTLDMSGYRTGSMNEVLGGV